MTARVCFVRHRFYPGDARLDNQVSALREAGYQVDVLCTRRAAEPRVATEAGVRVYRLPALAHTRGGTLRYLLEYASFWLVSFLALAILQATRHYRLIHVANLPDFLVFAALIPKIAGARVLLDLRECAPEMYHTRFDVAWDSLLMRVLIALERASIRFADAALTCTEQMRAAFLGRGAAPDRLFVMLNAANPELFCDPVLPDPAAASNGDFRVVTHGTITKRYGHEVLIQALGLAAAEAPGIHLEIMGLGDRPAWLVDLIAALGLQDKVTIAEFLPAQQLVQRLRQADCGVVPVVRNVDTDLVHTYKMNEYMALGIPAIVTRTQAVTAYYDEACLEFVASGDVQSLAQALVKLAHDPRRRYDMARAALQAYERYDAPKQKARYVELVNQLIL
jgi:glycosyltransferase involved in cell wall biosynthesis